MMWRLILIGVVVLGLSACGQVNPGERAVFVKWGEIYDQCYKEGFYFYNPIASDMHEIDVKVQKHEIKTTGASSDLQDVHMVMIVNFTIDGDKCHLLYKTVGKDFIERVLDPAGTEVAKATVAMFPVEKIIKERPRVRESIIAGLRARLDQYHIQVQDISLTNIDFSKEFARAIESKQIEEQNVQKAEYLRQQAVKEAERQVAHAQGQAQANALVRQSLTAELIQFEALKKWDGHLPQVTSGAVPFLNLSPR